MMRFFLCSAALCVLAASATTLRAQSSVPSALVPWQKQSPLPRSFGQNETSYQSLALRATSFVNASTGWAVGEQGDIYNTVDGGKTWLPQRSPTRRNLSDVAFVNPSTGWIVGNDGIFSTTDGGKTWVLQTADIDGSALAFVNASTGWAVGSSGRILATTDGGKTWQRQTSTVINLLRDVYFADTQNGWAVGTDGVIATTDGGKTWSQQLMRSSALLQDNTLATVWFANASAGWAGGGDSTLVATTDGGKTWQRQDIHPDNTLERDVSKLFFVNPRTGWAVIGDRILMGTSDGGKTWQRLSAITPAGFVSDITFVNETTGWAVSSSYAISGYIRQHTIWNTSDGGKTWSQQRSSRTDTFTDIALLTTNPAVTTTALAIGPTVIAKTTNAGDFWATQPLLPRPDNFATPPQAVSFLDDKTGWAVCNFGRVFSTVNSGNDWKYLGRTSINHDLRDVAFVNASTGWAVGNGGGLVGGIVLKTSDSGKTWTQQLRTNGITDTLTSIQFVSPTTGYAVGTNGVLLTTSNGGTTWTKQDSKTVRSLYGVFFLNETLGFAVGGSSEASILRRTRDGGKTWERLPAPTEMALRSVHFANANAGYAVGDKGTMLATRDGGDSWSVLDIGVGSNLNAVVFANPVRGWVVGDSGVIVRTTNGGFMPEITLSAQTLNFGSIPAGTTTTQTFSLQARYLLEPLTITAPTGYTFDSGNAGSPTNQTNQRSTITLVPDDVNAATNATFTVRFTPAVDDTVRGRITIASGGAATGFVNVIGVGLNRATLRASVERIDFGAVRVGTSANATFTLINVGTTVGTLQNVGLTNIGLVPRLNSALSFKTSPSVQTLRPGDSVLVTITFAPPRVRLIDTTLAVFGAEFERRGSGVVIPVFGVSGQSSLEFTPDDHLVFNNLGVGRSDVSDLNLTNTGNLAARIDSVVLRSQNFRILQSIKTTILDPRRLLRISIEFAPQRTGNVSDSLFVYSADTTLTAIILGKGEPPLPAPELQEPADGRLNVVVAPSFRWRGVMQAQRYGIQIARDKSFPTNTVVFSDTVANLGAAPIKAFDNSTTYYWRVRAISDKQQSDWSSVYSFSTIRANPRIKEPEPIVIGDVVANQTERVSFNLTNLTKTDIQLDSARWIGNTTIFSHPRGQFPQPLPKSRTTPIIINFTPRDTISYTAVLQVFGGNDTAFVQVSGSGVNADAFTVATALSLRAIKKDGTSSDSIRSGDMLRLQIVLNTSDSAKLKQQRNKLRTATFNAKILIRNPSVLAVIGSSPTFPTNLSEENMAIRGKTIELNNIPRDTSVANGVIAELDAIALQGNDTSTSIEFLSFDWQGGAGNNQTTIRTVVDNTFTLSLCEVDGKPNLITITPRTALQAASPNPVTDVVEISFAVGSSGQTELYVMDVLGRRVKTIASRIFNFGEYTMTADISDLAIGSYRLVLQSPSNLVSQPLQIAR